MRSRKGQSLLVVVGATVFVAFVLLFLQIQTQKSIRVVSTESSNIDKILLQKRLKDIFESPALCTCNLSGRLLQTIPVTTPVPTPTTKPFDIAKFELLPNSPAVMGERFMGYYDIPTNLFTAPGTPGPIGPVSCPHLTDESKIVVNVSNYPDEHAKAVLLRSLNIGQWKWIANGTTSLPNISIWQAKLSYIFPETKGLEVITNRTSKSNLANPIDLDIWLRVIPSGTNTAVIDRCLPKPACQTQPMSSPPPFDLANLDMLDSTHKAADPSGNYHPWNCAWFDHNNNPRGCASKKMFAPGGLNQQCCGTFVCDLDIQQTIDPVTGQKQVCVSASDMESDYGWSNYRDFPFSKRGPIVPPPNSYRNCKPYPISATNRPRIQFKSGRDWGIVEIDENLDILGSCKGPGALKNLSNKCPAGWTPKPALGICELCK